MLSFPASAATLVMQNDIAANTALQLNFNGAGYTVNGTNTIDLQALTQSVAGTNQINTPITSTVANMPVSIAAGGTVALNAPVSGSSGITKTGLGRLILNGVNPYTGTTQVGAGFVIVNGSINASQTQVIGGTLGGAGSTGAVVATTGTIAPGDGGTGILTVNGPLTLNTGVIASFDILGTNVGTQFDQLAVSGTVTLTGATLAITGTSSTAVNSTIRHHQQHRRRRDRRHLQRFGGRRDRHRRQRRHLQDQLRRWHRERRRAHPAQRGGGKAWCSAASIGSTRQSTSRRTRSRRPGRRTRSCSPVADLFPDALAGAPLAVAKGGPLVLTSLSGPPTFIDPRTVVEIQRVLTPGKTIFVLGGTTAIADSVVQQLQAARVPGPCASVAPTDSRRPSSSPRTGLNNPANLFLANGINFPDALSAGPSAAKVQGAILLTNNNVMPSFTQQYLASRTGATVFAIGGPAAAGGRSASGQPDRRVWTATTRR